MKGTIVILYPEIRGDGSPDDLDTLVQRDEIAASLARLGYEAAPLAVTLNLEEARRELLRLNPLKVFNLAESLGGMDRLLFLPPALLDALGISYTGCPAEAILATTNKLAGKERLLSAGLPTPPFAPAGAPTPEAGQYIVKSSWDHSSIGIGEDSIITLTAGDRSWHRAFAGRFKGEYFAEKYIDGREFNISLLQGEVLPPAEMLFRDYPEGKAKIVDYRAKWDTDAFEYRNTVRSFTFDERDDSLLRRLRELSQACWDHFGCRGYARVDFRVDSAGNPWILEVNANPCLSGDAGFMAAAAQAGLEPDQVIKRILAL